MCFICERVIVEDEQGKTFFDSKITTGMPSKHTNMTVDWLPLVKNCQSNNPLPYNSEKLENIQEIEDKSSVDIWYDAIDDESLLHKMTGEDLPNYSSTTESPMNTLDEHSDSFYDASDNFTLMDIENNCTNCNMAASGITVGEDQSSTEPSSCKINSEVDFDWDDGFEFYLWSQGEHEDSDSEFDSDEEDCDDDSDCDSYSEFDEDSDFIIFEESERIVNFSTSCSKSSPQSGKSCFEMKLSTSADCKCTEKKPKKHVHFSPELVTVYVVSWGAEECRKGPWIQFAVDRMHFHHRIAQLEQILTPCLLLKQKLGYQFLEKMNHSSGKINNLKTLKEFEFPKVQY